MKIFATLVLAALVVPFVSAAPNAATGTQTGVFWSQSTLVAAQGGTGFELHGVAGDFDVFFYNANGGFVGFSIACGGDSGVVPASATVAEITRYDSLGEILPCAAPITPGPSAFIYVDGL